MLKRTSTLRWALAALVGALVTASSVLAQTALTTTTTSAAMTAADSSIPLTSDTGVAAGTYLYVDGELMRAVTEIGTSARWNVRRGLGDGMTPAVRHASGSTVYFLPSGGNGESYFTYDVASGTACDTTDIRYTPRINTKTWQIAECTSSVWAERNILASGILGAVTQATNRTTGVTLNALAGAITTSTASLAAEGTADFTVTNAFVAVGDTVLLSVRSGSNGGGTLVTVTAVAAGSFNIRVHNGNVAAGTAETGAIIINFVVIKTS